MAISKIADMLVGAKSMAWWPPPEQEGRIAAYRRYAQIFDGDHINAFDDQDEKDRYLRYIVCNLGSLIVRAGTDILFGEELHLEFEEDGEAADYVADYWKRNGIQRTLYENALDGGSLGDSIIQVFRDAEGEPIVGSIPVTTWFPEFSQDDVRDVKRHMFGWQVKARDTKGHEVEFLKRKIHEVGLITNELFRLDRGRLSDQFHAGSLEWQSLMGEIQEIEETGIDDFLVVHVPNYRTSREYFGRSEFLGMESLYSAVNARLSQWDFVLTYHADPIMKVPPGIIKPGGVFDRRALDALEIANKEEDVASYLTYDASLEDNAKIIEQMVDYILLISETDKALLGIQAGGGPISGRALKFALMRTLAKVARKRLYWDTAIRQVLKLVQLLKGFEPVGARIVWPDGLPQDREELQTEMSSRLADKTIDRKRAIARLDDMGSEEAEQVVADIDSDDTQETQKIAETITQRRQPIFNVGLTTE